jgi:hypothetical protein
MSCVSGRFFPGSGSKLQILDPDPQHYFCLKRKICWSTFVYLNIFNGQMFKYAQILGSILRSFPLALAAEIVPKKVEWNDSLKNLVY